MSGGVAEIEELAFAVFLGVAGDDVGFDADGVGDAVIAEGVVGMVGELPEERGIGDDAGLEHFGEAVLALEGPEGMEGGGVGEDGARLMEGADEVFSAGEVDGGFAADGAVDHGEERGGGLDDVDAAEPDGGGEAGEVPGDAAAEGDDGACAGEMAVGEGGEQLLYGGEGFAVFAGGEDGGVDGAAEGAEGFGEGV